MMAGAKQVVRIFFGSSAMIAAPLEALVEMKMPGFSVGTSISIE
jgi:hypothetical protein